MRIDSSAAIGGYPVLTVRKLVRRLNNLPHWTGETVQMILRTERAEAEAIVGALVEAGLAIAEPGGHVEVWRTTQLAQSFASATAAKLITRPTADAALAGLLERVDYVNRDERFLARVTKVVLLGSYLRAEVDRLSDVDIAVELQPKEADWERLRKATQQRVEQLQRAGRRFRNWLEVEYWWHLEAFQFLKRRSRAISLIDYKAEREFVDKVPHIVFFSGAAGGGDDAAPNRQQRKRPVRRHRRPSGCPF